MAEYIDREPLLEILNGFYNHHLTMGNYSADGATYDCIEAVIEAPTADVVPRSEVEQLQRNLEQCENGYRQQIHILQCKHKGEIDGIFEEIEKTIMNTNWTSQNYKEWYFGELKKKYIGEKGE